MTRIDFYVLPATSSRGREHFACRLAEKAYALGRQIYIYAHTMDEAKALDDLLWTFRAGSFLPHGLHPAPAEDVSVVVGWQEPPERSSDVLINLSEEVPAFFGRFERVIELVDQEERHKRVGRERFRYYREQGCLLETHHLTVQVNDE